MKTTFKVLSIAIVSFSLFSTSCKKNATGGEASIHARIMQDNEPVEGDNIVYVKFNATTQPSNPTSNYDMKVEGEAGENHVHIAGLRPGKYYLYAVGTNGNNKEVHGGKAVKIAWSEKDMMQDVLIETVAD